MTMAVLSKPTKFHCPKCSKASRLPEPVPQKGRFTLTCAHCRSKVILLFEDYQYKVENEFQKPIPPLVQKKLIYEEASPRTVYEKKQTIQKSTIRPISKPNQRKKDSKSGSSFGKFLVISFFIGLFIFIITFATFLSGVIQTKKELPEYISLLQKNVPTKILDRNGELVSEIFQKRTSTLRLSDYPEDLISILLNIEDRKFYSHPGIDIFSIFRALVRNASTMSYKQGASTITQQLARIILDDRRKSIIRKIKEAQLALALEAMLSKDEILEMYMNQVYLGHGAFGFGEGIKFYFKKNPIELTREEMVLLASLPSAPNKYSPLKNPEGSMGRVEDILFSFRSRGIFPGLRKEQFREIYSNFAMRSPSETVFGSREDLAPYVTEHVRSILNSIEPEKNIYESGGYTIETTLDKNIQVKIPSLVQNYLAKAIKSGKIQKKRIFKERDSLEEKEILSRIADIQIANDLLFAGLSWDSAPSEKGIQAAVVAIQPETGEILFLHGGEEFSAKNQYNRALQMRRQTGSSIKAILYASAIDNGDINAGSKVIDAPLYYKGGGGKEWSPDNLSGTYDGEINLRTALIKSKNTAAVQIAEKMGLGVLDKYFMRFFFPDPKERKERMRSDLSVALGSLELSPLEMASAFTAFVNEGTIKRPFLIRKIINNSGEVIYSNKDMIDEFKLHVPEERQAIRPDSAEVITSLLRDSGRASGVRVGNYQGEVAGKTGTTNDYKDAWFVGVRPDISLSIWVGYDNPGFGLGPQGIGGAVAAPLWGEIVHFADENRFLTNRAFPSPSQSKTHTICILSGKEAGKQCTRVATELFLSDAPPEGTCTEDHSGKVSDEKEWMRQMF